MPLTEVQKVKAQRILIDELARRHDTQPLLLIDSILDGTAKQKLKMLLLQTRDQYRATHDAADANTLVVKANLTTEIADLNTINGEIV